MSVQVPGLAIPKILLPSSGVELDKWAVVACDQYTSEPEYWARVEETVGDNLSTLRMILPEVHLPKKDQSEAEQEQARDGVKERITAINSTMRKYLSLSLS
ncbi:uncharacterised conserved protein UCP033563, partial [Kipferlia bialata]|eukprot:g11896.t1